VYRLFYKPEDAVSGDYIPFFWEGTFHLFYLKDWRNAEKYGEGIPWFKVKTQDFYHFEDAGEMIPRGGREDQDLCVFTGSVIAAQGKFHIFYTGNTPYLEEKGGVQQAVMHAVSDDLEHWTKAPEDTLIPAKQYDHHHFRDPFVYYDEAKKNYVMLTVSRKNGEELYAGFTARYVSEDLKTWRDDGVFWAPNLYHTHECPDYFKMGDWWYLVFSEYSDQYATRYVMAPTPNGPWHMPGDDVFDGRAFYAAKTASDGAGRYLFGWLPTREGNKDEGNWQWGGNLVVHQLVQQSDGTLGCKLPESLNFIWQTAAEYPGAAELQNAEGRQALRLFAPQCGAYRVDLTLRFKEGTRQFGVYLGQDEKSKAGYKYEFLPEEGLLEFRKMAWISNEKGLNRAVCIEAEKELRLTLLVDGDACVLYVNDTYALCARMYEPKGKDIALFVAGGQVRLLSARLLELKA